MTERKRGTKVRPGELRRYEQLRDAGWTPSAAAEGIGRSKAWAHGHEKRKREAAGTPDGPAPAADLSDAVNLALAEKHSQTTGNLDAAFAIVDRLGAAVVPDLCRLVWFFAVERAGNLNDQLGEVFKDHPLADELEREPLTAEEILREIPGMMRQAERSEPIWWPWLPPRGRAWITRFMEAHPDLLQGEDAMESLRAGDPMALQNLGVEVSEKRRSNGTH